jgi:hypothetical protein
MNVVFRSGGAVGRRGVRSGRVGLGRDGFGRGRAGSRCLLSEVLQARPLQAITNTSAPAVYEALCVSNGRYRSRSAVIRPEEAASRRAWWSFSFWSA